MDDKFTLKTPELVAAAKRLGCSLPALQAVTEVESAGAGFLGNGKVKVLFEGHIFWKYTKGRYESSHPSLCYKKWTRAHYVRGANADIRGAGERERLNQAMLLNRTAALMSASYGMFQIMGFNFALCGYTSVDLFYDAMCYSADRQLDAFCEYVRSVSLADELRDRRWADFARKYNGPEYRKNLYDLKLARAYDRYNASRMCHP